VYYEPVYLNAELNKDVKEPKAKYCKHGMNGKTDQKAIIFICLFFLENRPIMK